MAFRALMKQSSRLAPRCMAARQVFIQGRRPEMLLLNKSRIPALQFSTMSGCMPPRFSSIQGRPEPTMLNKSRIQRFSTTDSASTYNSEDAPTYEVARVGKDGTVEMKVLQTQEILAESSIYARDLFSLSLTDRHVPIMRQGPDRRSITAILPRGKEILLSFGNIRALVGIDSVMIFDAHNIHVKRFANDLAETFRKHFVTHSPIEARVGSYANQPFELTLMEEVLRDTCDVYNRRIHLYQPIVDSFLDRVSNEVFSDSGVHQLVPIKDSLQSFEMQVQQALNCLTAVLDNDDDMLGLLLTEKAKAEAKGELVPYDRHETVELLLEEYARQLNNLLFEINYLLQRLQSKQDFVALALAGYRNRMLRMNLYLGIYGLSMAIGTTVAGFFGMNLVSGLETSPVAFGYVVAGVSVTGVAVAAGCASYLSGKTMQRRATQRLGEIETLTGALSDMCALDYSVKNVVGRGTAMDKDEFRERLIHARRSEVTDEQVDLLFELMDTTRDGMLSEDDFPMALTRSPRR